MAFEIPVVEPPGFAVGDRVQWTLAPDAYPISEGWTLKYYLRGNFAGGQIDLTATTSGTDYLIDLLPVATAEYTPGVYYWQSFVEQAGDRKPVGSGRIVIAPNFAEETQPVDGRSHARRVLDSINLVLEGRATTDIQRYVLQAVGRSVDKMSIKDLLAFRDYYLVEVQAEEAALQPYRKNVYIHFNR